MTKVLCVDIDDTLKDTNNKRINLERTCQIIKAHQEAGGIFMLVTDKRSVDSDVFKNLIPEMQAMGVIFEGIQNINDGVGNLLPTPGLSSFCSNNATSTCVGEYVKLFGDYALGRSLATFDKDGNESSVSADEIFIVGNQNSGFNGKVSWTFPSLSELDNDPEKHFEIALAVNNNRIKITTNQVTLRELNDGKFLHTLVGLAARGIIPTNLSTRYMENLKIENVEGCNETIDVSDMVLLDDKKTNLKNFNNIGGHIVYPHSEVLHIGALKHAKYNIQDIDGTNNIEEIQKVVEKINTTQRKYMPKATEEYWENLHEEIQQKINTSNQGFVFLKSFIREKMLEFSKVTTKEEIEPYLDELTNILEIPSSKLKEADELVRDFAVSDDLAKTLEFEKLTMHELLNLQNKERFNAINSLYIKHKNELLTKLKQSGSREDLLQEVKKYYEDNSPSSILYASIVARFDQQIKQGENFSSLSEVQKRVLLNALAEQGKSLNLTMKLPDVNEKSWDKVHTTLMQLQKNFNLIAELNNTLPTDKRIVIEKLQLIDKKIRTLRQIEDEALPIAVKMLADGINVSAEQIEFIRNKQPRAEPQSIEITLPSAGAGSMEENIAVLRQIQMQKQRVEKFNTAIGGENIVVIGNKEEIETKQQSSVGNILSIIAQQLVQNQEISRDTIDLLRVSSSLEQKVDIDFPLQAFDAASIADINEKLLNTNTALENIEKFNANFDNFLPIGITNVDEVQNYKQLLEIKLSEVQIQIPPLPRSAKDLESLLRNFRLIREQVAMREQMNQQFDHAVVDKQVLPQLELYAQKGIPLIISRLERGRSVPEETMDLFKYIDTTKAFDIALPLQITKKMTRGQAQAHLQQLEKSIKICEKINSLSQTGSIVNVINAEEVGIALVHLKQVASEKPVQPYFDREDEIPDEENLEIANSLWQEDINFVLQNNTYKTNQLAQYLKDADFEQAFHVNENTSVKSLLDLYMDPFCKEANVAYKKSEDATNTKFNSVKMPNELLGIRIKAAFTKQIENLQPFSELTYGQSVILANALQKTKFEIESPGYDPNSARNTEVALSNFQKMLESLNRVNKFLPEHKKIEIANQEELNSKMREIIEAGLEKINIPEVDEKSFRGKEKILSAIEEQRLSIEKDGLTISNSEEVEQKSIAMANSILPAMVVEIVGGQQLSEKRMNNIIQLINNYATEKTRQQITIDVLPLPLQTNSVSEMYQQLMGLINKVHQLNAINKKLGAQVVDVTNMAAVQNHIQVLEANLRNFELQILKIEGNSSSNSAAIVNHLSEQLRLIDEINKKHQNPIIHLDNRREIEKTLKELSKPPESKVKHQNTEQGSEAKNQLQTGFVKGELMAQRSQERTKRIGMQHIQSKLRQRKEKMKQAAVATEKLATVQKEQTILFSGKHQINDGKSPSKKLGKQTTQANQPSRPVSKQSKLKTKKNPKKK